MSGGSKYQTVGYKYFLGIHLALCHGPVDALTRIQVDKRTIFSGILPGGQIVIDEPGLFGGEDREGGIAGTVDIEFGGPTQQPNDYLARALNGNWSLNDAGWLEQPSAIPIPAYRGIVAAVLRRMYIGTSPYLKNWSFRLKRVHTRQSGLAQWYPEKAAIFEASFDVDTLYRYKVEAPFEPPEDAIGQPSEYISPDFDDSEWDEAPGGFGETGPVGGVPVRTVVGALIGRAIWLRKRVRVVNPGASGQFTITVYHDDGFWLWWNGQQITESTQVEQFVSRLTIPASMITEDNVIVLQVIDSVPGGSPTNIFAALDIKPGPTMQVDMNPAHIIRECLTDPDWGMGYQEADVDDASFTAAADRLFDEGMGISLLWSRETPIEDFIKEIVRHVDGALYVDRRTGKFVFKLIRDDYVEAELLVLGESDVQRIENYSRPAPGELVNSVVVKFWDHRKGETASVGAQDIALVAQQGVEISEAIDYPGFTNGEIAARVAARDLRAMSTPLASATIYAHRKAAGLNIGDPFILNWPEYETDPIVMRVTELALGDGRTNAVRIKAVQDIFSLPQVGFVINPVEEWTEPSSEPRAAPNRVAVEAPYYVLATTLGQLVIDELLTLNPAAGYLFATAAKPDPQATHAQLWVDTGAGYEETAKVEFCPVVLTTGEVKPGQALIPVELPFGIEDVRLGSLARIGEELVRVDALSETEVELGRGALDTVPARHDAGTPIYFLGDFAGGDDIEYNDGEFLGVKLRPVSGAGLVLLDDVPADTVEMNQRALRPYAPGSVEVNGVPYPEAIAGDAPLALTWAHRDRLQQTSGEIIDTTAGDIGPEPGVTYTLRIYGETDELGREESGLTGTSYDYSVIAENEDFPIPSGGETEADELWESVELLLHMNGTDAGTDFEDSSLAGRVITANGNAQLDSAQFKFGGASGLFDGSGDYLTSPDDAALDLLGAAWCVESWINPDVANRFNAICSKRSGTGQAGWVLWVRDTAKLGFSFANGSTSWADLIGVTDVQTGQWQHAAVSWDGTTLRLFLDGQLEASASSFNGARAAAAVAFHVGRDRDGNGTRDWDGWLDDMRITIGAARYTDSFTPPPRELPHGIPFEPYQTDFEDETVGLAPSGWTEKFATDVSWEVVAGNWLSVTTPGSNANRVLAAPVGESVEDARVLFRTRWTTEPTSFSKSGVMIRGAGTLGDEFGYRIYFESPSGGNPDGTHFTLRRLDGTTTTLLDQALFASPANTWIWLRAEIEGGRIRARAWLDGDPEPAGWMIDVEDGTYTAGFVGAYCRSLDTTFDFDDFSIVPISTGFRLNGRLRFELEAVRDGLLSWQKHDVTVLRAGYGFNYGLLYGGQ